MTSTASVYLTVENNRVLLDWGHGVRGEFAALWLADNRSEDRHANGQRLIDIMDLPADVCISSAEVKGDALCVQFAQGVPAFSRPLSWLRATLGPLRAVRAELDRHPWLEGARLEAMRDFAWVDHAQFTADAATRGVWLRASRGRSCRLAL